MTIIRGRPRPAQQSSAACLESLISHRSLDAKAMSLISQAAFASLQKGAYIGSQVPAGS
jgi:hypothetical protein